MSQLTYKLKRNHCNYSLNKIFLKTLRKRDAFAKNVYDKKWYKFDDQYVTEMSPREVVVGIARIVGVF